MASLFDLKQRELQLIARFEQVAREIETALQLGDLTLEVSLRSELNRIQGELLAVRQQIAFVEGENSTVTNPPNPQVVVPQPTPNVNSSDVLRDVPEVGNPPDPQVRTVTGTAGLPNSVLIGPLAPGVNENDPIFQLDQNQQTIVEITPIGPGVTRVDTSPVSGAVFDDADVETPFVSQASPQDLSGQFLDDTDTDVEIPRNFTAQPLQTDDELDADSIDSIGGDPNNAEIQAAQQANSALNAARQQATIAAQRKANGTDSAAGDWRVRLRLAPNATYLYKTPGQGTAGILEPLRNTDGIIFPYTPRIDSVYQADYSPYDLTHANYRGYFYKGSRVQEITMTAEFTAQDTAEADYLLATIHFLKSCTKMFYGQDAQRGSPPPLVYLSGYGEYQYKEAPCVVSQFNYNLPDDVDYIRARSRPSLPGTLQYKRPLSNTARPSYSLSAIWDRLTGAGLPDSATPTLPGGPTLGLDSPTYVPTKMTMTIILLPVQSRQQVSREFSLKEYANGNLLRKGYW